MAKASPVTLSPHEPFAEAGRRVVAVRAEEVFEYEAGVLDTDDVERVHDMRVATRRLRVVLEVFAPCFDPARLDDVLVDVRRLAAALGERRDPDVHLEAMHGLQAAVPSEQQAGLALLVRRLEDRQGAGNVVLAETLRELEESDLQGRLEALTSA